MAYRHQLALVLMGLTFQWCLVAVTADALKREWRPAAAEPGPVVLYEAAHSEVNLASLAPGCGVHDWACVTGAAYDSGYRPDVPKRGRQ